ncbi:uncharacterized protein LOC118279221 [Spodoptera frugiperda]|uniref:Uncharacterized protein LOC118279221 n=1 Tax=Spodoptera frugiperda TaxID=7108 RepID=A0A9R0DI46_SPOFR|nr:uncharacterized protein LOC118279221 [Spodoptera frugiperda]
MRIHVLFIALLLHTAAATLDFKQLKDTAATQLQTITDTAATKLQSLTDTATTTIQQFVDTIDLDKVQQLDVLQILPKLQNKGKLIKETYENLPEYGKKAQMYLQSIKGMKGDLVKALKFKLPWPEMRVYYHHVYLDPHDHHHHHGPY